MNPNAEIRHLLDLMPASGRMNTKLVSNPKQGQVIAAATPKPWSGLRPISINFDLWSNLPRDQRDLLLLHTVAWLTLPRWSRPSPSQLLVAAGALGTSVELLRGETTGLVAMGLFTAFAGWRLWQGDRSASAERQADETALDVARWRGYAQQDAAIALRAGIESVARLEGRPLSYIETLRCQHLRQFTQATSEVSSSS